MTEVSALVARVRATLKLISPDHITPMGVRMIEKVLDAAETRRPTVEEIERAKTPNGGYTRAQLEEWGVPWPPPAGWKKRLASGDG